MVNDVETVLREIRERVIAENESSAPVAVNSSASPDRNSLTNSNAASLDRLSAELAITARAWDRLPPLVSNRRGALGRFEISLKRICKPLTRWFTWEQVNFNAAVHHALLETVAILRTQEQELRSHDQKIADLDRELQSIQARAELRHDETRIQFARIDATLKRYSEMLAELAEEMRKSHGDLTNEIRERFPEMAAAVDTGLKKLAQDVDTKIAEISADFREEQRVCFKQLSLETGEAAILEDRGRRALESRVEKLERDSQTSK